MRLLLAGTLLFSSLPLLAQTNVRARILDRQTGDPVPFLSVQILSQDGKASPAGTDVNGNLLLPPNTCVLIQSSFYQPDTVCASANQSNLTIYATPSFRVSDEVLVRSTRASRNSGTTYVNIGKKELAERNLGQDLPYLLSMTPSTVVNSDAGAGVGYTGIKIRGVDPTRINVTVNGIPINDAESQGTFWVNMPDFASSVSNIQIQRGVGTSTNGTAAFGSSINLNTGERNEKAYAESNLAWGSFNTQKANISAGTGLINGKYIVEGRASVIRSDGFIDRASSNLSSYYLSASRYGNKSLLKLIHFSGREKTYQAWNGIPQEILDTNRRWNEFTYEDQTDNYKQDHYQLHYNLQLNKYWILNTALHYTRGAGYYEEYKTGQELSAYGIPDIIIPVDTNCIDTIRETDLIRQRWLDNHFYGGVYSLIYQKGPWDITIGGGYNQYRGDHFGTVIWARYAGNSEINQRYYFDDAVKSDLNQYVKLGRSFAKKWNAYIDLQYRQVDYSFVGYDNNLNVANQSVTYPFFNPKAGITWQATNNLQVYGSYAMSNREPNRNDIVNSTPNSRPIPEMLQNGELGVRQTRGRFQWVLNSYLMYYRDQLILTGQINDVGAYIRTNVPESYRAGIEAQMGWQLGKRWELLANATYSLNKVMEFTEFVDDYDNGTQIANVYKNTDLAFSPNLIGAAQVRYKPIKGMTLELLSKYVSKQYLDNTQNANRQLDAFWVNDFRATYDLGKFWEFRTVRVAALVNNLLAEKYEPNGYTFSGISGGVRYDYNYYYPQAGRNFLLQLTLGL